LAKIAMAFGVVLLLVGGGYFVATGSSHPTPLIPAGFGLLLLLCGVLANTEDAKKRMLWMHIAVTVGLLGFLGGAGMGLPALAHSATLNETKRIAMQEKLLLGVICLVFTALCVRSFIAARRARLV
jgi:hypothetical protein